MYRNENKIRTESCARATVFLLSACSIVSSLFSGRGDEDTTLDHERRAIDAECSDPLSQG